MAVRAWKRRDGLWAVAQPFDGAKDLARRSGTTPLVGQVLHNRGIQDVEAAGRFLNPKLSDLHDPAELGGAVEAAGRIVQAIRQGKKIVIYGDYDVDGMAGVAILHSCVRLAGGEAAYYVPHRLEEGYGVNAEAVTKLIDEGAQLMVTVDCGISAAEPIAAAAQAGVEVIVTDHHNPPPELPSASAIVHPMLPPGQYPNEHLSGAGVALKVAWQVARQLGGAARVDERMRAFLLDATCLAALGTIADVVPLLGENRTLAMHGLRGLPHSEHVGLRALLASAGLKNKKLDAYHVGFVLAPRLNAAGRMGHAGLAVELLTGLAGDRCGEIAAYLSKQNTERQAVERAITAQAVEMVESRGLAEAGRRGIVLWDDSWHGGVIGITASRLVERFGRPTILIADNGDGPAQGSGRSVPGFHMRDALAACGEHLLAFGGHAMAGGLKIAPDRVAAFAEAFVRYANEQLTDKQLAPRLAIDAEATLGELSYKTAQDFQRLAPFGQGNPRPLLALRRCRVLTAPRRMGASGQTVGLMLGQDDVTMRAVGFGMGDLADELVGVNQIDVAATPTLNIFRGRTNVELKLKDVRWE